MMMIIDKIDYLVKILPDSIHNPVLFVVSLIVPFVSILAMYLLYKKIELLDNDFKDKTLLVVYALPAILVLIVALNFVVSYYYLAIAGQFLININGIFLILPFISLAVSIYFVSCLDCGNFKRFILVSIFAIVMLFLVLSIYLTFNYSIERISNVITDNITVKIKNT